VAVEVGLEEGVLEPAGEGVAVEAEGAGGGGEGVAGEEELDGSALADGEGLCGLAWLRFAELGV
jgi:hypothetical protein